MIYLLTLVQIFIHVRFGRLANPHQVPVMPFSLLEAIEFEDGLDEPAVSLDQLKKEIMLLILVGCLLIRNPCDFFIELKKIKPQSPLPSAAPSKL